MRPAGPARDPARAILYAASTLSSCVVEVFGDTGVIEQDDRRVALLEVTRDLLLLDIRGPAAMRAGSVAALAKVADRDLSQAWSRYFYEQWRTYQPVDGILYWNAHNDEEAIALYQRTRGGLRCLPGNVLRLDDPALRPALLDIALENNLILP